jgi:hypothetical protein
MGRHELEDRVLSGLKDRLMAPDLVAAFVDAFNAEMRNLAISAERESLVVKRKLWPPSSASLRMAGTAPPSEPTLWR